MALELTAHLKGGTSGIARKNDAPGAECGTSGFTKPTDPLAFMRPGNESLLQDEHGTTIAKGSFDVGTTSNLNAATNEFDCTWRVEFKDVPETGFYDLSIAGHDVANISQAEAKAANWEVPLTLTW